MKAAERGYDRGPRMRLELKSRGRLISGCAIASVAGAIAAWLAFSLAALDWAWLRALFLLPWVLLFGVPLIAIVELIFVPPLVWAFEKYRWPWFNGWTACLMALVLGSILGFAFGSLRAAPNVDPLLVDRLASAAVVAAPAVVVALTIRLVAYRAVSA